MELDDIQRLVEVILPLIETFTGLQSRWTGHVNLSDEVAADGGPRYRARKEWKCGIAIHRTAIGDPDLLSTLVHECIHSVSLGLTRKSFDEFQGYEEGVAEQITRMLVPQIARAILKKRPPAPRAVFDHFIQPLEQLRAATGMDMESFYVELLRTPLAQREQTVVQWAVAAHPDERRFGCSPE